MTAEESKLTAQEMFEKYHRNEYGWGVVATLKNKAMKDMYSERESAYLAAHSAQQRIIDEQSKVIGEQAGEIAHLRAILKGIANGSCGCDCCRTDSIVARQALAGKEGVK